MQKKQWSDLPLITREVMQMLGDFNTTIKGDEIKGYLFDSKVYFDAYDLRKIAEACNEVADLLQSNAQEYKDA